MFAIFLMIKCLGDSSRQWLLICKNLVLVKCLMNLHLDWLFGAIRWRFKLCRRLYAKLVLQDASI